MQVNCKKSSENGAVRYFQINSLIMTNLYAQSETIYFISDSSIYRKIHKYSDNNVLQFKIKLLFPLSIKGCKYTNYKMVLQKSKQRNLYKGKILFTFLITLLAKHASAKNFYYASGLIVCAFR